MAEADATRYLRKDGWLKLYRSEGAFRDTAREREVAATFGLEQRVLDPDAARSLEPSLVPVFHRAVHWPGAASVSNPLAVTRAYAARFRALGGVTLNGDARTLRRDGKYWRVDAEEGPVNSQNLVVALGPWAPDVLAPLGIKLPMAFKRGYHRHFRPQGNAGLTRPVVDTEVGYCLAPMEQGIRLTTGAEFAARDAAPTPVQFDRLMPSAQGLFPLGEALETTPWMGSRPCFADSRPVIGRAPGLDGMWLAIGHAHWGLTLGPVTGRLVAEMMTGETPFCDPAPYRGAVPRLSLVIRKEERRPRRRSAWNWSRRAGEITRPCAPRSRSGARRRSAASNCGPVPTFALPQAFTATSAPAM